MKTPPANGGFRTAFTLIELLLVIAIIAILSGTLIAAINPAAQLAKGRDSTRKSDLAALQAALQNYYATYNEFPASGLSSLTASLVDADDKYMKSLPADPKTSKGYGYCYSTVNLNQDYVLCARLEYGDEVPNVIPGGLSGCAPTFPTGEGKENYCVTN